MRDRTRDGVFLLPGLAWLVLFFAVPLGIIFVVSLGTRDQFGGVILDNLGSRELPPARWSPTSCRPSRTR